MAWHTEQQISWDTITGSVIGPTHAKKNTPNQDAFAIEKGTDRLLISLADGHGSDTCFRSHLGSEFAVEAALSVMRSLASSDIEDLSTLEPQKCSAFIKRWAENTLKGWVKAVLDHLRSHPFTNSEVDALDDKGRKNLGGNALLAYGSTLMATLITPNIMLGFNLGDGDMLVYHGRHVDSVMFQDDHAIGNHTYSLCTSGSIGKLAYMYRHTKGVDALLLATDGYRNSYRSADGFLKVGTDMQHLYKKHGATVLQDNLSAWLKETTQGGSGDDITAAMVFFKIEKVKKVKKDKRGKRGK